MEDELSAIMDFVQSNRNPLAAFIRQKLLAAGSREYLDRLGKPGIEALEAEAAGVLIDLACALLRRLPSGRDYQAEEIIAKFPDAVRQSIRLPRSEAYHAVLAELQRGDPKP
jgi:hypothetical protein